uniref:Centrosomal protein 112 n=1 Tax=Cyprinus carpio carpio TaxID=630221 RepID=A0A9J7ZJW5_CYPCA
MSEQDCFGILDSEFDHYLVDMKSYVLKLTDKTERQRCALWIKKLCEPETCGSGLTGRKSRNMYSRLLLQMLRKGVLEGPFTHKPEAGSLKTLPTYMSIYLDEPLLGRSQEQRSAVLPDWVSGELGQTDGSWSTSPLSNSHRTKVLEAKHQEDTLRMQQKHDAEIQKVNDMVPFGAAWGASRQRDALRPGLNVCVCLPLSPAVQSLLRESQVIRQTKEKQISELKKMSDQSAEFLKNEWEKKLHAAVAEMEQEKFELQKKHTDNIQELLEDTNQRLANMEAEYSSQTQATEQMLHELETRVKQLSVEVENGNLLRQKVTQEKAELEIHIASVSAELQEANHSLLFYVLDVLEGSLLGFGTELISVFLMSEIVCNLTVYGFIAYYGCSLSCCQASEVIEDLEQTVIHLKQQIQEAENRRQKQLRVSLQAHVYTQGDPIFFFFFLCCRDKEEQLVRLRDSQRRQAQQAESALESFKKQVELSSEKTYADMKQQMEKVEADLIHSKSRREKQSKEFSYQLEELQRRYEQQIVELKLQHEQERTHLLQTHNAEKDSLVQDHQQEIDSLDKQARAAMVQQQTQTQEWRKRNAQTISDLEDQVYSLRKELLAAHSQTKQQLTELGVLREEERQRAAQDQQAALDQLRAEMDQVRQDLERTHKAERELAQEKTNSRFKHLEKEYNQKLAKSAQVIAELQTSLSSVKEDSRQAQQSLERQLQEAQSRWDEERRQLNRNADQTSKVLQERVESLQRQLHAVEKKLMRRELEYQEQITHVRQECESKIKGLIPAELQQELEDTITSLKSQVIKNSHWTHINTYMLVFKYIL